MKIFETYNKVKDYYVRPRIVWYFGKYKNDPSYIIRKKPQVKLFGKRFELPYWLKFEYDSYDVIYKYKWNQVRFEYPPKMSLVLFGISLSIWLKPPTDDIEAMEYAYWESLINWSENENRWTSRFKEHLVKSGYWSGNTCNVTVGVMSVRKEWVKPEFYTSWEIAKSVINKQAKERGVILL